jgi:pimeloyl-ACP methyl ester carboxylesterase
MTVQDNLIEKTMQPSSDTDSVNWQSLLALQTRLTTELEYEKLMQLVVREIAGLTLARTLLFVADDTTKIDETVLRLVAIGQGGTAELVRDDLSKAIKSAAPSYGVFSGALLNTYSDEHANDQAWKDAIAPLAHIPPVATRSVPQFLVRGTTDGLIADAAVKEFTDALVKAGQRAEYIQVGGAGHAFFDWKPDDRTKATFAKYGVYYAAAMKAFFVSTLY